MRMLQKWGSFVEEPGVHLQNQNQITNKYVRPDLRTSQPKIAILKDTLNHTKTGFFDWCRNAKHEWQAKNE